MEAEPEFIHPPICGHRVYMSVTGRRHPHKLLGFCSREQGHVGKCSHLIEPTVIHNRHVSNGIHLYQINPS